MPTLEEIVDKQIPDDVQEVIGDPDEGGEPGETEETPETEETEEEISPEDLASAKTLYRMLKDPTTQQAVVTALAVKAGVFKQGAPETKTEVKEAKKDIKALVKEKLGADYSFIADKLGDIMETVLEEARATQSEEVANLTANQIQTEVDTALARLSKETNGTSAKLVDKIATLCERYPKPDGYTTYQYLKEMYTLAGGKGQPAARSITERIQRNATDVPGRLRGRGTAGGGTPTTQTPVVKGLKAIVEQ